MTVIDLVREHNMHISDSISYLMLSDMCVETFGLSLPTTVSVEYIGEHLPATLHPPPIEKWTSCSSSVQLTCYASYCASWSSYGWSSWVQSGRSASYSTSAKMSEGDFSFGVSNMIFNIGDDVILDDGRWFWTGRIVEINPVFTNQVVLSHVAKIFNLGSEADFVTGSPPRSVEAYPDTVRKVVTYVSGNLLSEVNHTLFRTTIRT